MSWLHDKYHKLVEARMYEVVARVYTLHLEACMLFADKYHVYIDIRYMWLFISLNDTSWAWVCVALTILYVSYPKMYHTLHNVHLGP